MTQIATLVYAIAILGLVFLDRQRGVRTSKALWLPIVWFWIAGSRAVSVWLNIQPADRADQYLEGSPLDRYVALAMMIVGVIVLLSRGTRIRQLFRANKPVVAFLLYCAVSTAWSDYPDVSFRRWIKMLGDFTMILVVLTDREPTAALKRVLARAAFVLLPVSVLLIKYYPAIGRYWGHWEGKAFYGGVATDKNMLGKTCLIFGLGASWRVLQEMAGSRRARILMAQGSIVAIALWLFYTCNSMTSMSCFLLASGLMAAMTTFKAARQKAVVHALVLGVIVICACTLFLGVGGDVLNTLGRDSTLTGRTQLWGELAGMTVNPVLGTGFESFWLGKRLQRLWAAHWWRPNESHDGYLELYLNLGLAGVGLFLVVLVTGYRNIMKLLPTDPEGGRIRLAFFVVGVTYNFTEAATRSMDVVWLMLILSVIAIPAGRLSKTGREPVRESLNGLAVEGAVAPEPLGVG